MGEAQADVEGSELSVAQRQQSEDVHDVLPVFTLAVFTWLTRLSCSGFTNTASRMFHRDCTATYRTKLRITGRRQNSFPPVAAPPELSSPARDSVSTNTHLNREEAVGVGKNPICGPQGRKRGKRGNRESWVRVRPAEADRTGRLVWRGVTHPVAMEEYKKKHPAVRWVCCSDKHRPSRRREGGEVEDRRLEVLLSLSEAATPEAMTGIGTTSEKVQLMNAVVFLLRPSPDSMESVCEWDVGDSGGLPLMPTRASRQERLVRSVSSGASRQERLVLAGSVSSGPPEGYWIHNFALKMSKVFKKTSGNGHIALYLGKRDFVDNVESVEVVVFVYLACAFRYGSEDLDVIGLSFRRDIWIQRVQVYPPTGQSAARTPMQESLMKKIGEQGCPFSFQMPANLPCSVSLQPGDNDSGKHTLVVLYSSDNYTKAVCSEEFGSKGEKEMQGIIISYKVKVNLMMSGGGSDISVEAMEG
ncbi:Beta-arrestin-1 [Liparis tanakae]|uniref:Beta-arrestin-1 n=1 Tax=Liparis tanakae TaxID=230148 RepID=A0A4Z2GBT2_9TELE|nr:Beta-arrestin-1 [Liparis tanakae]